MLRSDSVLRASGRPAVGLGPAGAPSAHRRPRWGLPADGERPSSKRLEPELRIEQHHSSGEFGERIKNRVFVILRHGQNKEKGGGLNTHAPSVLICLSICRFVSMSVCGLS